MLFHTIIIDTNVLYNKDFIKDKKLAIPSNLKWLISETNSATLREKVLIEVPEIVMLEYKRQVNEELSEKTKLFDSLISIGGIPGYEIKKIDQEKSRKDQIEGLFEEFLELEEVKERLNFNVKLDYGCLSSIVKRSINKSAPFEGKNKESDKGFKDALLWESILSYKKDRADRKIYLYSKDKRFEDELKQEYHEIFSEDIELLRSEEEVLEIIKEISEIHDENIDKEIMKIKSIRKYISSNLDLFKEMYRKSVEVDNWLGKGTKVVNVSNITLDNILPAQYSSFTIQGDYYVRIKIESEIKDEFIEQSYNPDIHFEVRLQEDGKYNFEIVGIA